MSGGHHPAFEAVCDHIATELKAERAVIRGAGHNTQRTGAPFNSRLASDEDTLFAAATVRVVRGRVRADHCGDATAGKSPP
jgi:hypothetical protein